MFIKAIFSLATAVLLSTGVLAFAAAPSTTSPVGSCCNKSCCEGCPDCGCDKSCCDNCADGCDCTCES